MSQNQTNKGKRGEVVAAAIGFLLALLLLAGFVATAL